ncbi:hypothetical protein IV102_35915 [bacterium]|nr:hypothetical protein [bacterium]
MKLSAAGITKTNVFKTNSIFSQRESKISVPDLDHWQGLPGDSSSSVTLKQVEEWSLTFKNGGKAVHDAQGNFVESPEHNRVAVDALIFNPGVKFDNLYHDERLPSLTVEKDGMKQIIQSDGTLYLEPPGTINGYGYTLDSQGRGHVGGSSPFDAKVSDDHRRILFLVEDRNGDPQDPVSVSLIAGTSWMI